MTHYCLKCGNILSSVHLEERMREMCLKCGWIYYPHLKVSAGCLLEKDGAVLLARRANDPWKGCWYLPSGYVEENETLTAAAVREMLEETGLVVEVSGGLFDAFYYNDDFRGDGVVLIYRVKLIGGAFIENSEVTELAFFKKDAVPFELAGMAHTAAVHKWMLEVHE